LPRTARPWLPEDARRPSASDGRLIAVGTNTGLIRLIDIATGRDLRVLGKPEGAIHALIWSADNKWLAVGGQDGSVRVLEAGSGKVLQTPGNLEGAVWTLAFSPDGKLLAGAGADRSVLGQIRIPGKRLRKLAVEGGDDPYWNRAKNYGPADERWAWLEAVAWKYFAQQVAEDRGRITEDVKQACENK